MTPVGTPAGQAGNCQISHPAVAAFLGVPPTRRYVEVSGATFARCEGDRIVEEHVTWDPRALPSALGVIRVGQD
ncbi:hypothetical protein ACWCQQ_29340 [Streptomyces sp. NPDC002143]